MKDTETVTPLREILSSLANAVEWCISPELLSSATVDREKESEAMQEAEATIHAYFERVIETAKPDWSKEKHASNDAQMAYALGGKKAIERYEQNLKQALNNSGKVSDEKG